VTGVESRPVLVLGGTGFIGSHVAERLAVSGRSVRVVSRRGEWRWGSHPPNIEVKALDLADRSCEQPLARLAGEASCIIHLAGVLFRPGLPESVYRHLHVDGTRRLVQAARDAAAKRSVRLVHVSTTGVLGPTGSVPKEEDDPPNPTTPYEATKLEGEGIALAGRGGGLEVAVVRPGLVYGPRDLHLLSMFRSIENGSFRLIAGGRARWQPIYVEDVAGGILAASEKPGCDGGIYHLAGSELLTVADLARRVAALLGRRIGIPGLPLWGAMVIGSLFEAACRPFGTSPPLSRSRVRTLTQTRVYMIRRAERELGFFPSRELDEGLAATVDWYREHGYLGKR
jgi:nucleoside-diphosphate-sugar epimerase